jgi:hypothetical protein
MNYPSLIGKEVTFTKKIEDFEVYAEVGMKARIKSISPFDLRDPDIRDHVYEIVFDFTEFETYNSEYETFNYYDSNGIPRLNARQAGFYKKIDEVYFPSPDYDDWLTYFTVDNSSEEDFWFFDYQSGI